MEHQADDVLEALDDVVEALQDACAHSEAAAAEAAHVRERAREGIPLPQLLTASGRPSLVKRVAEVQQRLGEAATKLRRTQARELHRQGMTTDRIAAMFGVTRQRVSALLHPNGAGDS